MWISKAFAAGTAEMSPAEVAALTNAPTQQQTLVWNIGLIIVLGIMFYLLIIMPQQRRFKEHAEMLTKLKKGDRVVTGGGLVGRIENVVNDKEALVDLGNGIKVTALLSSLSVDSSPLLEPEKKTPANAPKAAKKKKEK